MLSRVWLFATPGTGLPRLLCPWGFSRQEYWSGLPCPPPGDLPNPGTELRSPALQTDSLPSKLPGKPKNTEWVAYRFSSGFSWPKNRTGVSRIAGGCFISWAIREAPVFFFFIVRWFFINWRNRNKMFIDGHLQCFLFSHLSKSAKCTCVIMHMY